MSSLQDNSEIVTEEGEEPFTCLLKPTAATIRSQEWLVSPTFDGGEPLGQPLSLQIVAPVPQVSHRTSFLSSDGLSIVLTFEKPVDLSDMHPNGVTLCTQVFTQNTLQLLHDFEIRLCAWPSKVQFVLYLNNNFDKKDIEVEINPNVLREDYQHLQAENEDVGRIRLSKMTSEWHTFQSRLLITGPSEIPACGTFSLSGLLSTPKPSSSAKYEWSLKRSDNKDITAELQLLVELTVGEHLLLDTALFQTDLVYIFSLAVRLDGDEVLTTEHKLWKYAFDAPIISLFSNLMIPITAPTVDQANHFWAEAYVPACVHPVQRIIVAWKVTDPRVLFNFSMAFSASYFSRPFSVPSNQPTTLIVSSFLGHRYSQTTGAGFTFTSEAAPLRAVIANGASMITVGTLSGSLLLSGRLETQPNVAYRWTCSDSQSHQPCYDLTILNDSRSVNANELKRVEPDYLLLKRLLQMEPIVELAADQLEPDKELIVSLRVADLNNTSHTSETELVSVKVVPNSKLQLFVGPVVVNDVDVISGRNPHMLSFLVPAHSKVSIRGRVKHPHGVESISWSAPNFQHEVHWTSKKLSPEWTETEVTFLPELIFPYAVHGVELHACDTSRVCVEAAHSIRCGTRSYWLSRYCCSIRRSMTS